MISKFGTSTSLATLFLLSSINGLVIDRSDFDERTVKFDSTLSCSRCIRGGYTFIYSSINSATQSYENISATKTYSTTNKCCNERDCGDNTLDAQSGQLLSSTFKSKDIALLNCPHKTDVCGKKTYTLADKDAAEVTLTVKNFSQADSCHWIIKATCDLPTVTMKDMTGAFADKTKVGLHYVEFKKTPGTTDNAFFEASHDDYVEGDLYDIFQGDIAFGDYADTSAKSVAEGASRAIYLSNIPGFLIEGAISKSDAKVTKYLEELTKYKADLAAYQLNLVDRGKNWIDLNWPKVE